MIPYIVKATRKPVMIPDLLQVDVTDKFLFMKFLNSNHLLENGVAIQFINFKDIEKANSVQIGTLDFAGIQVLEQWGIV